MGKFFVKGEETTGPDDWRTAVGKGKWSTGCSAKALAYCWEEAGGLPLEVQEAFTASEYPDLIALNLLQGYVERTTSIPGRGRASQTDLLAIAGSAKGQVVIAVEGKVHEGFDEAVTEWKPYSSENRTTRVEGLCTKLDLSVEEVMNTKYQLLHRTASAIIESDKIGAPTAAMLVHSFSQTDEHIDDYKDFVGLFGKTGDVNTVSCVGKRNGINLYLAWVRGEERFLHK